MLSVSEKNASFLSGTVLIGYEFVLSSEIAPYLDLSGVTSVASDGPLL